MRIMVFMDTLPEVFLSQSLMDTMSTKEMTDIMDEVVELYDAVHEKAATNFVSDLLRHSCSSSIISDIGK